MKYTRLTKEQFEALHKEFATFLASQSITKDEWTKIKKEKPAVALEELDIFSDLVWEKVLNNVSFLENNTSQQLSLFKIEDTTIQAIIIKINNPEVDLLTNEGLQWLETNINKEQVEILTGSKPFSDSKNLDIFTLIKQGAVITQGALFKAIKNYLPTNKN
jgi:hypothetical protein